MAGKKSGGKKSSSRPAPAKQENKSSEMQVKTEENTKAVKPASGDSTKPAKSSGKAPVKKPNPVVKYFRDLKSEFKKVVWPSRKTVVNNTGVVLALMLVSALAIWALDSGFAALLRGLLSLAG